MAKILLIDDDDQLRDYLERELTARGHVVKSLGSAEGVVGGIVEAKFDVVVLDRWMPRVDGMDFLKEIRANGIEIPVIVMTGESTPDTAIEAMKLGAFDYVIKPGDYQPLLHELEPVIEKAVKLTKPVKEVRVAPGTPSATEAGLELVGGKNKQMVEVYKLIAQFARGGDPVLIRGETGTGKELVARALHTNSPRKGKPFVALNCSAIPETLLESELFGHEANAFTGAKFRKGKFEQVSGGTLFLDEIGDMPANLQAKLLRVLDQHEVERLGGNESVKVDVRIVSATNRDLDVAIEEGRFRLDLFFRLNRVQIILPPLRDRLDDLPDLAKYFLNRAAEAAGRESPERGIACEAVARLKSYRWPGNVRELQNVIFRAFGVCRGAQLLPDHLELPIDGPAKPDPHGGSERAAKPEPATEEEAIAALWWAVTWAFDTDRPKIWDLLHNHLRRELIKTALERSGGNKTEAAALLDISWNTLSKHIKEHFKE